MAFSASLFFVPHWHRRQQMDHYGGLQDLQITTHLLALQLFRRLRHPCRYSLPPIHPSLSVWRFRCAHRRSRASSPVTQWRWFLERQKRRDLCLERRMLAKERRVDVHGVVTGWAFGDGCQKSGTQLTLLLTDKTHLMDTRGITGVVEVICVTSVVRFSFVSSQMSPFL